MNTFPNCWPSTKTSRPSDWTFPGAGPHWASISSSQGRPVDDPICRHSCGNIRVLAEGLCAALQNRLAQRLHGFGDGDVISPIRHGPHRGVERGKDIQVGRRSRRTCIGRETKEDNADLPVAHRRPMQGYKPVHPGRERLDPFEARGHGLDVRCGGAGLRAARTAILAMPPGKDCRIGSAVEFRQCDQHRRLDRSETLGRRGPLSQRLELQRVGDHVRNVQPLQHRYRRFVVVVGRPADQREPGQRQECIDLGAGLIPEKGLYGGAGIQPASERRDHAQPARLKCPDHGIIMGGVGGQDIAPHEQKPDCPTAPESSGRSSGSAVIRFGRSG